MKESLLVRTHRHIVMNRRVEHIAQHIADLIPTATSTLLDVGAGTGEMAQAIRERRPELDFTGVDIYIRPKTFIPVKHYDGSTLPFEDASFDAVMTVDVLHHCDDPLAVIRECARVSRRWVIIKDHIADGAFDRAILRFMDWVGNRAHGVRLPYNYLSTAEWQTALSAARLEERQRRGRLGLYPGPAGLVFDRNLHFISLLQKQIEPAG